MLTNYKTVKTRIKRLVELEKMEQDGTFDMLPKKEVAILKKEMAKLQDNIGGIKDMKKMPTMIFVVDPKNEHNAVSEAKLLNIPLVGIVDTNCDPDDVDYVIPANDDAIRAVKLIADKIADAVNEAKGMKKDDMPEEVEETEVKVEAPVVEDEVEEKATKVKKAKTKLSDAEVVVEEKATKRGKKKEEAVDAE